MSKAGSVSVEPPVLPFSPRANAESDAASRFDVAAAAGLQRKRAIAAPFHASSKEQFWALASKHPHPASKDPRQLLPDEWQHALQFQASFSTVLENGNVDFSKLIDKRKSVLCDLFQLQQQFEGRRQSWSASLDPDVRKVIGHVNVPLLRHLAALHGFPDSSLMDDFAAGHPAVGDVPRGGFLPPRSFSADLSVRSLLDTAAQRQQRVVDRVTRWGLNASDELLHSGYTKTLAEYDNKSMIGPFASLAEVAEELSCSVDEIIITARFTIEQKQYSGSGSGDTFQVNTKQRNVDDETHAGLNSTFEMGETYRPLTVDDLAVLQKSFRYTFGNVVILALFETDFKSWYRQHAIR